MTSRIAEIAGRCRGLKLIWFGTRGLDALPLLPLSRSLAVVSQIAPIPDAMSDGIDQDCLETRCRRRRDLDAYDIDRDVSIEAIGLKSALVQRADGPLLFMAYRPAQMLAAPIFCNPSIISAMNFHLTQRQFEYKPWVERQLRLLDPPLPMVHWTYVRLSDVGYIQTILDGRKFVGRPVTGSGGVGIFSFSTLEEFVTGLPKDFAGYIGVAGLLENAPPLNVNGCIYADGRVAVFGVSYQLIGIHKLTRRPFGFCGNDFAAATTLAPELLDEIEVITRRAGSWLASMGYRGIFGLDVLLGSNGPLVAEINARFQASTPLSAAINQHLGLPDPMTEHAAVFLGLPPPRLPSLSEQVYAVKNAVGHTPLAQVIHRNVWIEDVRVAQFDQDGIPKGSRVSAIPTPDAMVDVEAMLYKTLHDHAVTSTGYEVLPEILQMESRVHTAY